MEPFPEHSSKQASQPEPKIEDRNKWDMDQLLGWIEQKKTELPTPDDVETLRRAGEDLLNLCEKVVEQKGKKQDTNTDLKMRKRKSLPHTDMAPSPKRTRVGGSSLIINGKLKRFRSGSSRFPDLLNREGQAYFDRTGNISKLEELDDCILFCRPRRFGKSLTVSMLEHFHGLQYRGEHQSLYKGLDVQNDIEQGKVKPGRYFILKLDFSEVITGADIAEAKAALIASLNDSIRSFYKTYATYLGQSFADLCKDIDSDYPHLSLKRCVESVQCAIQQGEQLAGIEGIYLLIDEYDALPNSYIEPLQTGEFKTAWENTPVGATFKSFWTTIKSWIGDTLIARIFITGISPLSLSSIGSGFNTARNLSFHRDLAGLCGLKNPDLKDALNKICKDNTECDRPLSEMTKYFNGYHFCMDEKVNTVYNTETCLAYLQCLIERVTPTTEDPENSEISEQFLNRFAASAPTVRDFEKALELDKNGDYAPLLYGKFKLNFTLENLGNGDCSSWRSLAVYFGGLTFHSEMPTTHLKIPNLVASRRIAQTVLEKHHLRSSLEEAFQCLIDEGKLERLLGIYRALMVQRDVTSDELSKKTEPFHRDSFYCVLLQNPYLVPRVEFKLIKNDNKDGRVDLMFESNGWLIVTEWKFYRIQYLDVKVAGKQSSDNAAKAATLYGYSLADLLQLKWAYYEKIKDGTLKSWTAGKEAQQLRDYVTGPTVKDLLEKRSLTLRAHLVVIVGSRHILMWDMDEEGNLAADPRLV